MFHDKPNKENIPSVDNNINKEELMDKTIDKSIESYCPIIFIDEDQTLNYEESNTVSPEIMSTITNTSAVFNANLPEMPYNYLYCLDDSSAVLIKDILINRIKEESLISIMSVLDNVDANTGNIFITFFDLRQCINDCLMGYNGIDNLVEYFIRGGIFSIDKIDDTDNTKLVVDMMASNIFNAIIMAVNGGVNKSIDGTIFRIHLIPNIMNLKDIIIKRYDVPKQDQNDERFWVLANVSLKNTINTALHTAAYPVIYENVKNILQTSCNTSYFVYRDAITEKSRKTREEREAERAALKGKSIEDVEF